MTGAAGGIGRAVCVAFADAGAAVAAVDRDADALAAVVDELPGGAECHCPIAADLTDIGGHDALVEQATERLDRLDGLVQLAAVLPRRHTIDDVTEEDWDVQHDLNLTAAFFLARAVAVRLRAAGGGTITNYTSQGWWTGGFGGSVAYATEQGRHRLAQPRPGAQPGRPTGSA